MEPTSHDPFQSFGRQGSSDSARRASNQQTPTLNTSSLPQSQSYHNSPSTHAAQGAYARNVPTNAPLSGHNRVPSQHDSAAGSAPDLHFQGPTPKGTSFPGPLQSSGAGPMSATGSNNPTPTQTQYTPSSRPFLGQSHSYSKSSPIGLDQRYVPFSTPTNNNSTGFNRGFPPQTPTGSSIYSPLDLSDIRPRQDSDVNDADTGPNAMFNANAMQTTSNYITPWPTYAFDWCKWPIGTGQGCGKMAVGSYLEDPHNFIRILDTQMAPADMTASDPTPSIDFVNVAEATCAYPVTRIAWEPPSSQKQSTDLLATSGDHLRLWSLPSSTQSPQMQSNNINRSAAANAREPAPAKLLPLALLSNSKTPQHTAPLTSLDWNTLSPKLIITSSIDTTCTIWDIPTLTAKTQLIAHDKEVFDVGFCAGSVDVFVSCGADGSVRMFDLRSLEHSTIIYEPSEKSDKDKASPQPPASPAKSNSTMTPTPPLLRLAASPHDAHLLATFAAESNIVRILDVRQPGNALLELHGHSAALNTVSWNPNRRGMLSSGADDSLVLTWDLLNASNGAVVNGGSNVLSPQIPQQAQQSARGQTGQPQPQQSEVQVKGPVSSWRCDFEVSNVSWAPKSTLTSGLAGGGNGDWLGVCGGRGIWAVKI